MNKLKNLIFYELILRKLIFPYIGKEILKY